MVKAKVVNLNLNTIISGVAVLLVTAGLGGLWNLNTNMVKVQANQDTMSITLKELIPRNELDGRFRSYDRDILELRSRIGATELEIIKIRDNKR